MRQTAQALSRRRARDLRSESVQFDGSSSIQTLPDELLARIFGYIALGPHHADSHAYGWISLSHVCRHWRAVVNGCATLWSHVLVHRASGPLLDTVLERSGNAPLSLTCLTDIGPRLARPFHCLTVDYTGLDSAILDRFSAILCSAANRIASIVLQCSEERYAGAMLLWPHMPSLRRLFLVVHVKSSGSPRVDRQPLPLCSPTILEELTLYGIAWPWVDLRTFTSLWKLEIHCPQYPLHSATGRHNVREVARALQAMPHLTRLQLRLQWIDDTVAPDTYIRFPQLQSLELAVSAHACISLLDAMSFPAHISLSLPILEWTNVAGNKNHFTQWTALDYTAYLSPIARKVSQMQTSLRTVMLSGSELSSNKVSLRAWNRSLNFPTSTFKPWSGSLSDSPGSASVPPVLNVCLLQVAGAHLYDSISRLPLANIECARIRDVRPPSAEFVDAVRCMLATTPQVKMLRLSGFTLAFVTAVLARAEELPHLETLSLECVPASPPGIGNEWFHLARALDARRQTCAVRKLQLHGMNDPQLEVTREMLERVVEELILDS